MILGIRHDPAEDADFFGKLLGFYTLVPVHELVVGVLGDLVSRPCGIFEGLVGMEVLLLVTVTMIIEATARTRLWLRSGIREKGKAIEIIVRYCFFIGLFYCSFQNLTCLFIQCTIKHSFNYCKLQMYSSRLLFEA
jgi:hypothetical protein